MVRGLGACGSRVANPYILPRLPLLPPSRRCIVDASHMHCKGTKNIDAKQGFLCFISDLFEMLKLTPLRRYTATFTSVRNIFDGRSEQGVHHYSMTYIMLYIYYNIYIT